MWIFGRCLPNYQITKLPNYQTRASLKFSLDYDKFIC